MPGGGGGGWALASLVPGQGGLNCKTIRKVPSLLSQLPLENCQRTKNLGQMFRKSSISRESGLTKLGISRIFFFFITLVTGPRRSLILKLSDTRVYEPQKLGISWIVSL